MNAAVVLIPLDIKRCTDGIHAFACAAERYFINGLQKKCWNLVRNRFSRSPEWFIVSKVILKLANYNKTISSIKLHIPLLMPGQCCRVLFYFWYFPRAVFSNNHRNRFSSCLISYDVHPLYNTQRRNFYGIWRLRWSWWQWDRNNNRYNHSITILRF